MIYMIYMLYLTLISLKEQEKSTQNPIGAIPCRNVFCPRSAGDDPEPEGGGRVKQMILSA